MIAVQSPDEYPQLVAEDANASYSLDKAVNRRMALDLVVSTVDGREFRVWLRTCDIADLVRFIESCKRNVDQFFGLQIGGLRISLDPANGGNFQIRWRSETIDVSTRAVYLIGDALRPYVREKSPMPPPL